MVSGGHAGGQFRGENKSASDTSADSRAFVLVGSFVRCGGGEWLLCEMAMPSTRQTVSKNRGLTRIMCAATQTGGRGRRGPLSCTE